MKKSFIFLLVIADLIVSSLLPGCNTGSSLTQTTGFGETSTSQSVIVSPALSLAPNCGIAASQFTINGSNFTPYATIKSTDMLWNGQPMTGDRTYNVDGAGDFSIAVTLSSESTAGSYTIEVTDSSGNNAAATFTVLTQATTTTKTTVLTSTQTTAVTPVYTTSPIYSNPVTFQAVGTLTVKNTDYQLNWFKVWEPSIHDWGNAQTNVVNVENNPTPSSSWQDANGNGGVFWEFPNSPAAGSSITITNKFTFTSYQIDCQIDPGKIGAYDQISADYRTYTQPEKYIESDNPQIQTLAAQLKHSETNLYIIAGAIYDWVAHNLTYTINPAQRLEGALYAFENRSGECGDFSALFCALCRADGIPARPIIGRIAKNVTNDHDGLHVWAEFYLSGYGWVPVDVTWENGGAKARQYFGHIPNGRLILEKDFTEVLQPASVYMSPQVGVLQTNYYEYEWSNKGQTPFQITLSFIYVKQP
jgi:transglutaminase-like putative cysteine protease